VGSGTAGVGFTTSTTGWENIVVSWDQRFSNTSSRFFELQYTLDVTAGSPTWVTFGGTRESTGGGDFWLNNNQADLSGEAGVANNANFGFRIVSVFGPGGAYVASSPTGTYAGTGTWRFDYVTVRGTEIPAPGSVALIGLGGLIGLRRRR
jgi:MYXO-CTERM domain-containing protein